MRFSWRLEDPQEGEPTSAEPLIQADRQRLREVLDHLLANAIAYSPAGGTIEVTIRPVSVQVSPQRAGHTRCSQPWADTGPALLLGRDAAAGDGAGRT